MTERKVLSCSPDVSIVGLRLDACLWYPRVQEDRCIDTVDVSLVDVRAARGIRIRYDFERDGYAILAECTTGDESPYAEEVPEAERWKEEAFIPAWMTKPPERCRCGFVPLAEGARAVCVLGGKREGSHDALVCPP